MDEFLAYSFTGFAYGPVPDSVPVPGLLVHGMASLLVEDLIV
jgi:hypothetical protein